MKYTKIHLLVFAIFSIMILLEINEVQGYDITSNGGECNRFGTWNAITLTCTINQDITDDGITIHDNGITLDGQGFTVATNFTGFGVVVFNVDDVIVQNVELRQNKVGIVVLNSNNIVISENNILESGKPNPPANLRNLGAIAIMNSENITVERNSIRDNISDGIFMADSEHNLITENSIENNIARGIVMERSSQNEVVQNEISNQGAGVGIWMDSSHDNRLEYNHFVENSGGIDTVSSRGNIIMFNTIEDSSFKGTLLAVSSDTKIACNDFSNNQQGGVDLRRNSASNIVILNNFLTNSDAGSILGVFPGINAWNLQKPVGGNYWESFSPTCPTADNIFCQNPLFLIGGDMDNIPRVNQIQWRADPAICFDNNEEMPVPDIEVEFPENIAALFMQINRDGYTKPIKQVKSGIEIENVLCKSGYLLMESVTNKAACVKPHSITKLQEYGWKHIQNTNSLVFDLEKDLENEFKKYESDTLLR